MNKGDLQNRLANNCNLTARQAAQALNEVLSGIQEGLVQDGHVRLAGFGNFTVKERAARTGRNPQTGETMEIPARKVVTFSASSALKEKINQAG